MARFFKIALVTFSSVLFCCAFAEGQSTATPDQLRADLTGDWAFSGNVIHITEVNGHLEGHYKDVSNPSYVEGWRSGDLKFTASRNGNYVEGDMRLQLLTEVREKGCDGEYGVDPYVTVSFRMEIGGSGDALYGDRDSVEIVTTDEEDAFGHVHSRCSYRSQPLATEINFGRYRR